MNGSVLFGVEYHSWVIETSEEEILLTGGGPDDGDPLLMTSDRSEFGGLAAGLAFLGTLARSGLINIRSVKCVWDNTSSILASKRHPSDSIFHKIEIDYDVISTIHELQEMWCNNLDIKYPWVKGHADNLYREPDKYEQLNILVDEICDEIRSAVTGIMGARGSCGTWSSETCAFFIRSVKITSHIKEILTHHILDEYMQKYLMDKENWTRQVFNSINWRSYGTAFKCLPRSRKTAAAKACHNLWHTGGNTNNIMAVRSLLACVAMRTNIGDTLSSARHLTQAYTEQNHGPKWIKQCNLGGASRLLDGDRKSNKSLRSTLAQKR
jgi:hypothetical protein